MPTRRRPAGVALLREVVQQAVEATTLRRVAREVGVSAPGLALFLDGAVPREESLDKYRAWYLKASTARGGCVSRETARLALGVLSQSLPTEARGQAQRGVLRLLLRAHQRHRIAPPGWLRDEAEAADAE
jgi:hypothetical protein